MYNISANYLFDQGKVLFMPSCHSTNAVALQLAHQQASEGSIVITDCQTAGQGQRGNTWEAEPGMNLTFSFLLKPGFLPINHQFLLTKVVSLSICHTLKDLGMSDCCIKWPNDIYIQSKKICGILIQNTLQGNTIQYSIVGIGLNINQINFKEPKATSIRLITGTYTELNYVLDKLLSIIAHNYQILRNNPVILDTEYMQSLFLKDIKSWFKNDKEECFEGTIRGVDESGRLEVEMDSGITEKYQLKEIMYLQ